ncbi:Nramp family divalent metal transporter [Aeoliella sp. ICT_H6.2]|uniref:Nramp family divalent metal transporter n=1 Tax=Aeoliella straminimaris TaxID=2954799 RepID=A0A9X2FA72_9BACT|nr:Nramp family divalent metal transporter [Aeoliella straminimaris]MCO6044468.1 Nramp family divalent metal transporter [Aeoliella straminimaris]
MAPTVRDDPYSLDPNMVREPPTSWWESLGYVGPGFVLSASIVGSGELIATTVLGARAGFIALWIILLSCVVKVALQLEFGRYTIAHGTTAMEAISQLPGPRARGTGWMVWLWLLLWPVKILQVGGILGGVAMVLVLVFPGTSAVAWCWTAGAVVAVLVSLERYGLIERTSLVLLSLFSLLTLSSVAALQWTEYAVSMGDLASGLTFQLPGDMLLVFGAFGLTGVGGDEIMSYTYWLLEKGYAAYTGPYDGTDQWRARARGWIRVMYLDAFLSMIAYTVVTMAFFVLGAAVLHVQDRVPEGDELVETLATMYTHTLGEWARWLFLAGAFVVLFSTLFSALAAWTRICGDAICGPLGLDFRRPATRGRLVFVLAWLFPVLWAGVYTIYPNAVNMVLLGGVATSAILLMVVHAAMCFRFLTPHRVVESTPWYDSALLASAASITVFALVGLWITLAKWWAGAG